jgi:hypothetical protein
MPANAAGQPAKGKLRRTSAGKRGPMHLADAPVFETVESGISCSSGANPDFAVSDR